MKKTPILLIILLLAAFSGTPISALAASNSAGIKPGSFFYFFDTTFEKVNLFFTFNPEKKAQKALEHAEERLAEAEAVAEEKNTNAVKTAVAGYESNIALAAEESKQIKDKEKAEGLLTSITDQTSKHQEILTDVYNKVPEQAKEAIKKAIDNSIKGQEEARKQIQELKTALSGQSTEIEALRKEVDILKKNQQKTNVTEKIVEVRPSTPLKNTKKLESEEIYAKIAPTVVLIETSDGSGTGIIIESDGVIITNAHVVSGATRVTVKIGGLIYTASVLGRDEGVDLALLKMNGNNLSIAELGDSSEAALKRGEELFAFGYPLDFSGDVTATRGILSARQLVDGVTYLQTDASIHPGNSGGPLVNNKGQVIGINSLVLSARGKAGNIGGTGIGFAIPVNVARGLIPDLKAGRNIIIPRTVLPETAPTPNQEDSNLKITKCKNLAQANYDRDIAQLEQDTQKALDIYYAKIDQARKEEIEKVFETDVLYFTPEEDSKYTPEMKLLIVNARVADRQDKANYINQSFKELWEKEKSEINAIKQQDINNFKQLYYKGYNECLNQ